MGNWICLAVACALFLGLFFIAIYLCIPKVARSWHLWKATGKVTHLSDVVAIGSVAFFLLLADLLIFLQAVGKVHA